MNLIKHGNIFSGILLLSFMAIMIQKELQGIELNQYLWKNRIILTFAEDEHPDLIRLKVEMKENNCEILNRDLLHFHLAMMVRPETRQLRMINPLEYCSSERTEVLSMNPNDPFP